MEEGHSARALATPKNKKRTWTPESVTNAFSTKRRRISSAVSLDLTRDFGIPITNTPSRSPSKADRFISSRPSFSSLQATPRSNRIARVFGLVDNKVLHYTEGGSSSSPSQPFSDIRTNFSKLLAKAAAIPSTSAAAHLGKRQQFLLALDGPGVSQDIFAYPISWSGKGIGSGTIAVACDRDVYYQDLDTRSISHLCRLPNTEAFGRLSSIDWCVEDTNLLAAGTTTGVVQLWDAATTTRVRDWVLSPKEAAGGMCWKGQTLTVGSEAGILSFFDARQDNVVSEISLHNADVLSCRWSHDGNYLASSDHRGVVYIWDVRASKVLTNGDKFGGKIKHHAPVKALSWCPWQPDLLATGSFYPDGKIRVFSTKSLSVIPEPLHTVSLHTQITSLQWSQHCKELLSTHGKSWDPLRIGSKMVPVKTALTNALAVHSYPSMSRVINVTAHGEEVGQSCLSPDGTMVFTISPKEEAMKMWKIWSPPKDEVRHSVFDQYEIR
ncbi:WD40 repeat-like protein [Cristinia sonorae]|uniref:WD40 repeat-like protein n=1 Tax=Cristinia sonorae TaxID=1940300 RepID=A0A8K0UG89_9AGAR|nr:WD40 repeat-like protein [Cristinia sonorae]